MTQFLANNPDAPLRPAACVGVAEPAMWFRDVAFVTCVCFGAYALTELGVRVFRNRVVPHERLEELALEKLSLVVLALAGAICALVSRGEARRARLNTSLVQRSARRDALFHQKVLTAVSKRDPSKDRAGATRVDLLAHLARVDPCSSPGARVTVRDPHPNLPPLLATPARRTAARDACRRASGVTGGTQLCQVPASFHLADVLDGATRKSRALTANGDCNANVELAATLEVHASASQGPVWEIAGEESTTRFATGGVSLDPKDGLDRVVAVASVLVDLANGNSLTGLQPGEVNRVGNKGTPATVRLRLEVGAVLDGNDMPLCSRFDVSTKKQGSRPVKRKNNPTAQHEPRWTELKLTACLVVPWDAKRSGIDVEARLEERGRKKNSRRPKKTGSDSDSDSSDNEHGVALVALRRATAAMGGYTTMEPATGPDALGTAFISVLPLLRFNSQALREEEDDDAVVRISQSPRSASAIAHTSILTLSAFIVQGDGPVRFGQNVTRAVWVDVFRARQSRAEYDQYHRRYEQRHEFHE